MKPKRRVNKAIGLVIIVIIILIAAGLLMVLGDRSSRATLQRTPTSQAPLKRLAV